MKRSLIIGLLFFVVSGMAFSQKIISSKGEQKEIEGLNYLIIIYDWKNGGRSETFVDMGDGLSWQFYDQIAKKQRKIFASPTELLNFMDKNGWRYLNFIPGYNQIQKIVFIRNEAY
jgi:hypothetical protein